MRPFHRSIAIAAVIAQAMMLPDVAKRQAALADIPLYRSRGKGKDRRQASSRTVAQNKRTAVKARNVKRNRAAHRA